MVERRRRRRAVSASTMLWIPARFDRYICVRPSEPRNERGAFALIVARSRKSQQVKTRSIISAGIGRGAGSMLNRSFHICACKWPVLRPEQLSRRGAWSAGNCDEAEYVRIYYCILGTISLYKLDVLITARKGDLRWGHANERLCGRYTCRECCKPPRIIPVFLFFFPPLRYLICIAAYPISALTREISIMQLSFIRIYCLSLELRDARIIPDNGSR
jgi:hypothetical protein